ncbi:MAG: hypothetical protein QOC87_1725 [Actinomycetota bacterium]|jgi:WD40 repeat protein|nr:hypothetical protein [Actinomycetota bacterium]
MALEGDLVEMFARIGSQPVHPVRGFASSVRRARIRQAVVAVTAVGAIVAVTVGAYLVRDVIGGNEVVGRPTPVVTNAPGPSQDELVVVDSHPTRARVLDVVPRGSTFTVPGGLRVGYNPSVVLEQGDVTNKRVFLAAHHGSRFADVLSSVDLRSGNTHRIATLAGIPRRDEGILPVQSVPTIVASSDGARLYIPRTGIRGGGLRRPFDIATFDLSSGAILPQSVLLGRGAGGCGSRDLMPLPDPHQLLVLCAYERQVFKLDIADDGSATPIRLDLPEESMWGALSPDASTLYAVSASLKIYVVDVDSMTLTDTLQVRNGDGTAGFNSVAISPSGDILYIGVGHTTSSLGLLGNPKDILAIDVATGDVLARIAMSEPARGLVVDSSGRRLYATGAERGDVLVVDTVAGRQIGTYHVGGEPTQILATTRR